MAAVRHSRFDWRRILIYTHRWLGIGGCLVFLVWFVSGLVMMYARMPRLTPDERLTRLEALVPSRIAISLDRAVAVTGTPIERARVGMVLGRPVYRLEADGIWTAVYADSGDVLQGITAEQAVAIVQRFLPEHARTAHYAGRLTAPDQWTLDGGMPRFLPMQRIALGDADDTYIYVSERTGEPVMKTTASGRTWGYLGAVLHWTYFTPFRVKRELWRYSIIYAALIGCVMCLSGLIVGIWRLSPRRRYRLKRVPSHSPYAGWMWWHHYAGLLFGLFAFTWALSGALSLTPWDWAPSTEPTEAQKVAVSGGPFRASLVTPDVIRGVVQRVGASFPVKELELLQFAGRPMALAYRPDPMPDAKRSRVRDVSAIFAAARAKEHRLVWLDTADDAPFENLGSDAVLAAARAAVPDAILRDADWLHSFDAYYYDRTEQKPLPVLRATYSDPDATALYLDPRSGQIVMRQTTGSRVNRWLYNGLHSLDFPVLYGARPMWDVVVIALSAGGIALAITSLTPAFKRLRRHARMRVHGSW